MTLFSRHPRWPVLPSLFLALLFVVTLFYQVRHLSYISEYLEGRIQAAKEPFGVSDEDGSIKWSGEAASAAGIRKGDLLVAVNGTAYRGSADLFRAMHFAQPGDWLVLTVRHPANPGRLETLRMRLEKTKEPVSANWLPLVVIAVFLPLFCVTLGFWVAAVRPRDPLAWLLLALLLCYSQLINVGNENRDGSFIANLALAYNQLCGNCLSIWLFLIGLYFPTRLAWERRIPWLKWLWVVPQLVLMILLVIDLIGTNLDYTFAGSIRRHLTGWLGPFFSFLILFNIFGFFIAVAAKYFLATTSDARRRLRLFFVGSFLALVPTLILVIIVRVMGKDLDMFPDWLLFSSLMLTLLFPLTLAYLIVIHKAMDVSVVIRQGVQYALLRGGVKILQAVLIAGLIISLSYAISSQRMSFPKIIMIISGGVFIVLQLQRLMRPLATWVDRRFFREAYNAELLLTEMGERVRTLLDTSRLLETVANGIADSLHVSRIAVILRGLNPLQPVLAFGYEGPLTVNFPEGGTLLFLQQNKEPARVYLSDPRSWVNTHLEVREEERQTLAHLQSEVLLPLMIKDRLLGFISLSQKKSEAAYSASDLRVLNSVASQTALALENAQLTQAVASEVAQRERMSRELEIAREVQQHLFPQVFPAVPALDYAGSCRPALGVGGDYFDFFELPGKRLGFAVGDVSGKGISAALMMSNLQAALRSQTMLLGDDLAGVVTRINKLIYQASSADRYATFFLAEFDSNTRKLSYVNAGHNPPLLLRASQREEGLERLQEGGLVIGLLEQAFYQQATVVLEPGDWLVAYTDGITETMNNQDEEWGEARLLETLHQCQGDTSQTIMEKVVLAADAFAGNAPQHDDMTLVVLCVE